MSFSAPRAGFNNLRKAPFPRPEPQARAPRMRFTGTPLVHLSPMRSTCFLSACFLIGSLAAQDDIRLFQPATAPAQDSTAGLIAPQDSPQVEVVRPGQVNVLENDRIKTVMANYASRKQPLQGYRVQIYLGERASAEQTRRTFLLQHPDTPAYLSYLAPNFRVRVGDIRDRVAAEHLRQTLQHEFPGLYVVPDLIEPPRLESLGAAERSKPGEQGRDTEGR